MEEQTHKESIAGDLFQVLQSAREQGLEVNMGFEHRPFESRQLFISYLFQPKALLDSEAAMPPAFKKQLKAYNILGALGTGKRLTGVFLLAATDTAFSRIQDRQEILDCIQDQELERFSDGLRGALKQDLNQAMGS